MQNKNIVLFSSGISEKNGILTALSSALSEKGFVCEYWRELFSNAKDANHIALLPMLIKKIPTFDYAVLVCEGHDRTVLKRGTIEETVCTMRDNVLFEIGLCVMALGPARTILVTDGKVRLPDDLTGLHHETAVKTISYVRGQPESCSSAGQCLADYLEGIEAASDEIRHYIDNSGSILSPVVIGAASSTACGYVSNFVFRTLEHIGDGVVFAGETKKTVYPTEKIFLHILLPASFQQDTPQRVRNYLQQFLSASVPTARSRPANFHCTRLGDELHIIDVPTTLVTSYDTARMILSLDADDTSDPRAASRFVSKEMNLYEATLRELLCEEYLEQVLEENYSDAVPEDVKRMKTALTELLQHRLTISVLEDVPPV